MKTPPASPPPTFPRPGLGAPPSPVVKRPSAATWTRPVAPSRRFPRR